MPSYTISRASGAAHLVATRTLEPADFDDIANVLGAEPFKARKIGFVSARQATERCRIETRWNGKESEIIVEPGDWIVANMTPDRQLMRDREGHLNIYAIRSARFPELYESNEGKTSEGDIHRTIGEVEAIFLPGGFEIMAPWGQVQRAEAGYLLKNGADVYGNASETFDSTYQPYRILK